MATWPYWNDASATSSTCTATSDPWHDWSSTSAACTVDTSDTAATWGQWAGNATAAATGDTVITWIHWDDTAVRQQKAVAVRYERSTVVYDPPKVDVLEGHYQWMQTEINRIWRKKIADELAAEKKAAETKAKELLLDLVSQKEFDLYEKTGRLLVKGRKNSYVVKKRGGVDIVINKKKGKLKSMCVHLNRADRMKCPDTDNVIAMKFHIEQAEKAFLKTANHHSERNAYGDDAEFLKAVNE